jgi:uncharacterized peroxidase-related enzyme
MWASGFRPGSVVVMSYLTTIPEDEASGPVAEMYDGLRGSLAYVPNYARVFSHRPEVFKAWRGLIGSIRSNLDPRRYELATVAAAGARRGTYCAVAHGEELLSLGLGADDVVNVALEVPHPGLEEVEQAVVDYAAKVARDPVSVTETDIDRLRHLGLSDTEIFDIAATAAARCFFTALLDGTGTLADSIYRRTVPELVSDLAMGRPVAD